MLPSAVESVGSKLRINADPETGDDCFLREIGRQMSRVVSW
jgi:hypothetical protein